MIKDELLAMECVSKLPKACQRSVVWDASAYVMCKLYHNFDDSKMWADTLWKYIVVLCDAKILTYDECCDIYSFVVNHEGE